MADGASYEEAVANAQIVSAEWVETTRSLNRPIPEPKGKLPTHETSRLIPPLRKMVR